MGETPNSVLNVPFPSHTDWQIKIYLRVLFGDCKEADFFSINVRKACDLAKKITTMLLGFFLIL